MFMIRFACPVLLATLLAIGGSQPTAAQEKPAVPEVPKAEKEPKRTATTLEALTKEIEALKVAKPAWREIAWKSCLIEGLKESRDKNKPVVLWVFIDRPADDARC
jgi:hypothetical protein